MLIKIFSFLVNLIATVAYSGDDNVVIGGGQGVAKHGIALQTPSGQIHVKVNAHGDLVGHVGLPNKIVTAVQNIIWDLALQGKLKIEGSLDTVSSKHKSTTLNNDWRIINNFVDQHVQKFDGDSQIEVEGSTQTFNRGAMLESPTVAMNAHDNIESVQVPRYFKTVPLSSSRVMAEVDYYMKHNQRWSQRVVLEMFYYDILGEHANPNSDSGKGKIIMLFHLQGRDHFYTPTVNLKNWITHEDICAWEGITCHNTDINDCLCMGTEEVEEWEWAEEDECNQSCECPPDKIKKFKPPLNAVTKIELNGFDFVGGRLSAYFHHLPFLTHLNLSRNRFITHIPPELGLSTRLRVLDLSHNDILGSLPSELYQLRRNLKEIKMHNVSLEGKIPDFLYHMNLSHLDLGFNNLSGSISSEISHLSNLRFLHFGSNTLSGSIPKGIFALNQLRHLNLGQNYLKGSVPLGIGTSHSQLRQLTLGPNGLNGIFPQDIFDLKYLEHLDIRGNEFWGEITGNWSSLTNLSSVDLSSNEFDGMIPANIFVRGLKKLDLSKNYFSGALPNPDNHCLSEITNLDFSRNLLTGTLPSWLTEMKSLKQLGLTQNR